MLSPDGRTLNDTPRATSFFGNSYAFIEFKDDRDAADAYHDMFVTPHITPTNFECLTQRIMFRPNTGTAVASKATD